MHDHPFLTGVSIGMLAGAAVGVSMVKNEKSIKRKAKKAAHSVGTLVEDTADALIQKLPR